MRLRGLSAVVVAGATLLAPAAAKRATASALVRTRSVRYAGRCFPAGVYDRDLLPPGARLRGPALVVDAGSTTFLPPGFGLGVDAYRNLRLRRESRS